MSSATQKRDRFYSRDLTTAEQSIASQLALAARGETREFGAVTVTRGNFGPYWYVTNQSGYRCESQGRVDTAVYVSNLLVAYHEQDTTCSICKEAGGHSLSCPTRWYR